MAGHWKVDVAGVDKDFNDDLEFPTTTSLGTGMPPVDNLITPMALQPGGVFEQQNFKSRSFRIRGSIVAEGGEDKGDVHTKRQNLIKAISSYPDSISGATPTRQLKYTGAAVDKVIHAVYDGGLEDEPPLGSAAIDIDIRFIAPDPFFYATSETTEALDSKDTPTISMWVARLNGEWDNLDLPAAGAANEFVTAIAADDTYIYLGGDFLNFDGIAAADYIVRYHKTTGAYTALGSGLNNTVYALTLDSNGDLIVGGNFTNAGGVGAADNIAVWDGSAWAALGTPAITGGVNAIAIAPNGDIYFGGGFTNLGSVANADYVGYWDISAGTYNALSTGVDNTVEDIAIQAQDNIILIGNFDNAGGSAAAKIVKWDGSAFSTLGSGLNAVSYTAVFDKDGTLYIGGDFTTANGVSINRVASWNGATFSALGTGADAQVRELAFLDNGKLIAAGNFVVIGDATTEISAALWNGSSWENVMVTRTTAAAVTPRAIYIDGNNIYLGLFSASWTRTIDTSGATNISYSGTAVSYPYIEIGRSGGSYAKLHGIKNVTTGAQLLFDYLILDGETITIDTRSQEGAGITSDFTGDIPSAILPNSNLGQFFLTPDNTTGSSTNVITVFVDTVGSPTITANLKYTATYLSLD